MQSLSLKMAIDVCFVQPRTSSYRFTFFTFVQFVVAQTSTVKICSIAVRMVGMCFCMFRANWSDALHTSSWNGTANAWNIGKQISRMHLGTLKKRLQLDFNTENSAETHSFTIVCNAALCSNKHSDKLAHKSKYAAFKPRTCNTKFHILTNANLIKTFFFLQLLILSGVEIYQKYGERRTAKNKFYFGGKSREKK